MPRDIKTIPVKISRTRLAGRKEFVNKQKGKVKLPKKAKKPENKRVSTIYGIRMTIRQGASLKRYIEIVYLKATTGETKKYKVAPYSYRYVVAKNRRRKKMLYAYDFKDRHIKGFYVKNIKSVKLSNGKFTPLWPIEI